MKTVRYAIMLMLVLLFFAGCAFVNIPLVAAPAPLEEQIIEDGGNSKILLLDISGTITEQEKSGGLIGRPTASMISLLKESLAKAEKDKSVSAILLRINSPGGTITGSDIIYHELSEFKKRRGIPVVACIMGIGASGAYYISAAADEIVAHPTAITGSIGVIIMKFTIEALMGKIGIEEQTVKSGAKKDIMSPFRKATAEEMQIGQEIIDQFYGRFLDIILARKGNTLTREELKKAADGRIYTAEQALKLKLVDRIAYLDEVITELKKKLPGGDAKVITYYPPGNFKGSVYAGTAEQSGFFDSLTGMGGISGGGFMYLWKP